MAFCHTAHVKITPGEFLMEHYCHNSFLSKANNGNTKSRWWEQWMEREHCPPLAFLTACASLYSPHGALPISLELARKRGPCDHCSHLTDEKSEARRWIKRVLDLRGEIMKISLQSYQHTHKQNKENKYSSLGYKTKFWKSLIFRLHCVLQAQADKSFPPWGKNKRVLEEWWYY